MSKKSIKRIFPEKKSIKRILSDGTIEWRRYGRLHREDGPALIDNSGTQMWVIDGKVHRKEGPAIIRTDGICAWYLHNKEYSFSTWYNSLKLSDKKKIEDQLIELKLTYG